MTKLENGSTIMDGHGRLRDEKCGLYGDGQHFWHYSMNYLTNIIHRKCSYCGIREQSKTKINQWSPEE